MSLPYGDVVLDDSGRPVVFASAGIGITPMAGMLSHLVTAGSGLQIVLLHADLNESSFAMRQQVVDDIGAMRNASIYVWYEQGADSTLPVLSQETCIHRQSFAVPHGMAIGSLFQWFQTFQ